MYKQGVPGFKYFVGIDSLAKVATREDRVCVLNILGGESSDVTPVSHAFSGGNVVFGTSPGRGGQKLKTPIGDVPVFNSVREGLNAGPPLQHRRGLPAALGRARRRGRAGPGQSRSREDHHHHREGLGPRCARDPCHRPDQRHRHLRRQRPGRGRRLEPGAHRRRARRRQSRRDPAQGLGRDLLQLRQLHHHHRQLSGDRRLGHHDLDLQRQGRLHPLRRARVHPRARQ